MKTPDALWGNDGFAKLSLKSFLSIKLLNPALEARELEGSGAGLTLASAWPLDMVRFEGLLVLFLVGVSRTLGSSACDMGALSSPGSSIRCACFLHASPAKRCDLPGDCPATRSIGSHKYAHASSNSMLHRWNPQARTCAPDLCGGADLSDIPDASGYLPSSLACQVHIISQYTAAQGAL